MQQGSRVSFDEMVCSSRAHLWVAQHAHIQVRVAQPQRSILEVLYGSQDNLSVEVVCYGVHVLALDGQLRIEEREVELQLAVPCSSGRIC